MGGTIDTPRTMLHGIGHFNCKLMGLQISDCHLFKDEAEAEIELLRKTFEENEEQHEEERIKYEELIKNSENEIQSLAQDFEIYRVQLSEKDEQMKQLIEIKDQLSHFIDENDSLKAELQIQYQKVTEKTEENDSQKSEISGFKRQIELLEGQVNSIGVQGLDQVKVIKAQNSALSIELGETEESLRACQVNNTILQFFEDLIEYFTEAFYKDIMGVDSKGYQIFCSRMCSL